MPEALVQVVNEHDEPVAEATKQELWSRGLIHRIVRVVVEDTAGRILLQKRALHKQPHPDCWDVSASGHVDAGETYEPAAYRELQEELGVIGVVLVRLGKYRSNVELEGRKLNRFNMVYQTTLQDTSQVVLEDDDVAEVRWYTLDEIRELIAQAPQQVTTGLKEVMKRYYSNQA